MVLVYTLLLAPVAIATGLTSIGGPVYMAAAVVLNILFVKGGYDIWKRTEAQALEDDYKTEKKVFRFSLLYLFLHFGALLAEAGLRSFGLGGW
jgi:protoheme IX farnesyltransferase